jgi:hypothetical protein
VKQSDDLLFNGERLIPLCEVGDAKHPCKATADDPFPPCADVGTRYYRLEADNHARFWWLPDRTTWLVQMPGGEVLEFGHPKLALLVSGGFDSDASVDYDEILKVVPQPQVRKTVVDRRFAAT